MHNRRWNSAWRISEASGATNDDDDDEEDDPMEQELRRPMQESICSASVKKQRDANECCSGRLKKAQHAPPYKRGSNMSHS